VPSPPYPLCVAQPQKGFIHEAVKDWCRVCWRRASSGPEGLEVHGVTRCEDQDRGGDLGAGRVQGGHGSLVLLPR